MAVASQQLGLFIGDLNLYPVGLTLLATCINYVPPSSAHFSNVERLVPDILLPLYEERWGLDNTEVRPGTPSGTPIRIHTDSYRQVKEIGVIHFIPPPL